MANYSAMTSNNWIAKHASAFITNNFTQMEHIPLSYKVAQILLQHDLCFSGKIMG